MQPKGRVRSHEEMMAKGNHEDYDLLFELALNVLLVIHF